MKYRMAIAVPLVQFSVATTSSAQKQAWPANGHFYEVVLADNPTWFEARDAASLRTYRGANGYLATVTTAAEQDFLVANLGGGVALNALWLGGYQDVTDPRYAEPSGSWKWITGELWNTGAGAPVFSFNNLYMTGESEEHLITWWDNGGLNDYYFAPSPSLVPARPKTSEQRLVSSPRCGAGGSSADCPARLV